MLNEKNERELAYLVKIDDVKPIEGRDKVECAVVGGWTVMVRKDQFKPGDLGIYFEIDSKVPEKEPFLFLEKTNYKIKTQKYAIKNAEGEKIGQFWSQGLLMSADDFGWYMNDEHTGIVEDNADYHSLGDESRFLTKRLEVIYADAADNKRKASSDDKYKKMAQRNGKLFSHQPFRWLMRRTWGKKLLFVFFGKKKDKRTQWPEWVQKTDEERVQNMPWILENKNPWVATEKVDGTSTTFTMKKKGLKREFYVCSRNVVFTKDKKDCYYDTNVYLEMAEKYNVEEVLSKLMDEFNLDWVTLQGETYGEGIQKRDYSLKEHRFAGFNLIFSSQGRLSTLTSKEIVAKYDIPWVPIVNENFILPDTVDELLAYATNDSIYDGGLREGIVFRSKDGSQSFKAVSNEFLMKYHQ